ncbi:MAG: MFS transporter [Deltaproteobacteria bacterium]|nr:MFS transporter [Deltaproteobacteria bacterium]
MADLSSPAVARRAWTIFGIGCVGFVLSMFYRLSVTVISPDLARDLHLNAMQLGSLSAAFFYAFAITQIPLGLALDTIGARAVMTILSVVGILGAVIFALAQTAGQAVWGRILLGIGMSCNLMGLLVLMAAWFPAERFATLLGLFVGIGSLGGLLAASPLALLAGRLGWRGSFLAIALINAINTLVFFLVVRNRPDGEAGPKIATFAPLQGLWQVIKFPSYWWISLGTFFRYGCLTALQGLWAGPYLVNVQGLSILEAGHVLLVMSVGYVIGLPIFGRLSDHLLRSRKWVIQPAFFGMAAAFLFLVFWPQGVHPLGIYLLFFALGLLAAPGQIMYSHIKELVPPEVMGTATTGINLFTMLGPAFIMQAMGLVVTGGPSALHSPEAFQPAWLLCVGGLILAGLLYLLVPESGLFKREGGKGNP